LGFEIELAAQEVIVIELSSFEVYICVLDMTDIEKFEQLLKGDSHCISVVTHEEDYALEIVRSALMPTKRQMFLWSASEGLKGGLFKEEREDDPLREASESPVVGLVALRQTPAESVCVTLDLAEHLKDGKCLRLLRDLLRQYAHNGSTLVLIDHMDALPEVIKTEARSFEVSLPDEAELKKLVERTLRRFNYDKPIEIGISKRGFNAIIRNLRGLTRKQAESIIVDTVADDREFTDEDLNIVLANKRRLIQRGGLLDYVKTPLTLDQIGGMSRLKTWLKQRKNAFQNRAQAFGLEAPRGVLMLGVQGGGKSLCAKAIAAAWQQPLLRMDPSSLYASYIGQSERNLREALKQTEMMAPVILWIDEIEKAFAAAASRSSDGGLSQRMFGTLLTWMQDHTEPVFVVATANDIEALPPELLRKGRFDEIFFVDLPSLGVRQTIFAIHLQKRHRDPETFDLRALAAASEGFSGAEIEQAVLSALHQIYGRDQALDTERILKVLQQSPPLSVTMAEKMQALRVWAKNRCVPAD